MNQNQQSEQPAIPSRTGSFVQMSVPTLPSWQSNKAFNRIVKTLRVLPTG